MNKLTSDLNKLMKSRSLKYGSNSLILIAAVVAITVIINMLVGMTSLKFDLTPNGLYSLSSTSKDILGKLKTDVEIYGLFDDKKIQSNDENKELTELLKQYAKFKHVKVSYVDPDKDPLFIDKIDPQKMKDLQKNNFVVKCGDKLKKVTNYELFDYQYTQYGDAYKVGSKAEQGFTGAIKYVTSEKTPTIYFTTGHQEKTTDKDYPTIKNAMQSNNYDTKNINLVTAEKVPDDASILIVASPKRDLSVDEKTKIKDYIYSGGKAIFLFDYPTSSTKFAQFDDLLSNYNIALNYDRVKETNGDRYAPKQPYDIVPNIESNDINTFLTQSNMQIVLSNATSFNILKNQKDYITVTPLVKTTDTAEGESMAQPGQVNKGSLNLALAVSFQGGTKPAKVAVIGNGDFLTDTALNKYGQLSSNGLYFFFNTLNWMEDKTGDTVVAAKSYDPMAMNVSQTQVNVLSFLLVIILPILILGLGTFVWMRRRHL